LKKLKREDVTNILDQFPVTSDDIEKQISGYSLEFSQTRNQRVEWGMAFPMFVPPFYQFIRENNGTIPTQEEYWLFYLEENEDWFNENELTAELLEGLKARVYRSYPSYVRDIHFAKYLQDNATDIEVMYDIQLDIEEGIDLLIVKKGIPYAVNLYTDTQRANSARKKKTFRHKNYTNVVYVELPIELDDNHKHGKFFLYGKRELDDLLTKLTK
jgi:hypothetical protein